MNEQTGPLIVNRSSVTEDIFIQANLCMSRKSLRIFNVIMAVLTVLLGLCALVLRSVPLMLLVVVYVVYVSLRVPLIRRRLRRRYATYLSVEGTEAEQLFYDDRIVCSGHASRTEYFYDRIFKVSEEKDLYLLWFGDPRSPLSLIVIKDGFSGTGLADFEKLITQKLYGKPFERHAGKSLNNKPQQ